ncbi:MAG: TatD family hydrolase [Thermoplasmata archaeon]|nr:TatD family hydrolase [Thermoplasmata archaeon]
MTLPSDLPVVDHHCHLAPGGEGVRAAARFRKAGGTHLFLTTQSYAKGPIVRLETYREQFETTEALAKAIRTETGVVAYVVVAPYPVDLIAASVEIGLPAALDLHRTALDLAGQWARDGRTVALGEVGRAHFPVAPDVAAAIDEAFVYALGVARDAGCPAVVHSEDLDADGMRGLARLASSVSFPLGKLVKHYQRSIVPAEARSGVVPSFLARRDLCTASLREDGPWFWETDFLDDPGRPGAVMDIETVPKRARTVADRSPEDVERLRIPFVRSIESVYGFTPNPEAVPP